MSFKTIWDKLAASLYPGLISAIKSAAVYFLSASFLQARKDKIEPGEDIDSRSEEDEAISPDMIDESDFNKAPAHWLAMLQRNKLSFLSFSRNSHYKKTATLHVNPKQEVFNSKQEVVNPKQEVVNPKQEVVNPKQEVINPKQKVASNHKKLPHETDEVLINPVKNKRLIIENTSSDKYFEFKSGSATAPCRSADSEHKKDRFNIEDRRAFTGTHSEPINIKQKNNYHLSMAEPVRKKDALEKILDTSACAFSHKYNETINDQAKINNQRHIISLAEEFELKDNIVAAKQGYIEQTADLSVPLKVCLNQKPDQSGKKYNSMYQPGNKSIAYENDHHEQGRSMPVNLNNDNSHKNHCLWTNEDSKSYWQDLPEDVWNEAIANNELTKPHLLNREDIRGILWNG